MVFLSASLVPASIGSSSSARAAMILDAVRLPLGVAHKAIARASRSLRRRFTSPTTGKHR